MGLRQSGQPLRGRVHQVAVHEHCSKTVWDRIVLAYTPGILRVFCSGGFPYVIPPAFSTPAFSTPAVYSCIFHSCIFHSRVFSAPRLLSVTVLENVFDNWMSSPSKILSRRHPVSVGRPWDAGKPRKHLLPGRGSRWFPVTPFQWSPLLHICCTTIQLWNYSHNGHVGPLALDLHYWYTMGSRRLILVGTVHMKLCLISGSNSQWTDHREPVQLSLFTRLPKK